MRMFHGFRDGVHSWTAAGRTPANAAASARIVERGETRHPHGLSASREFHTMDAISAVATDETAEQATAAVGAPAGIAPGLPYAAKSQCRGLRWAGGRWTLDLSRARARCGCPWLPITIHMLSIRRMCFRRPGRTTP